LRFPEFSGEWKEVKIGNITTKVGSGITPKGGSSVYTNSGHIFIRSQNVDNGAFLLKDVAYIDEATHQKQKSTELVCGDVLLNITGASIGRSAVVNSSVAGGNVNQHVCIIRVIDSISPNFLCNYLLSYRGQKQIDSFQAGGNREGLNFEQIKSIKFKMPTTLEQNKITSLLSKLDERIATQKKVIEKLQSLIGGIRKKIFHRLETQCGLNRQVGDLLDYEQPSKYIVDSDEYENDQTLIPVLTANKAFILGYTNESFGVYDNDECIILDDFTLDSKYVTFKFKVKSSAIKILTPKHGANLRYIFEYLQYKDMISTEHKRHYISEVEPMEICYPDENIIRNKIVSLLASYQDKLQPSKGIFIISYVYMNMADNKYAFSESS
jgi:hypothetical protein